MIAHFFDINTLITVESEVWIVSKRNPNLPILKMNQSDFNLIRKGLYRKTGTPITIANTEYFLPQDLMESLKIKCKKTNVNITELSFSMQEFMNPEIIENLNHKIWKEHLISLKNSNDDIYIICSKNTKKNYEPLIKKLEEFLFELGLKVKKYYHISETFYNRDEEKIAHKKVRLILQHLVGMKTENDKFCDEELNQYDEVNFYDDERTSINLSKQINSVFKFILDNTEKDIKEKIESIIKQRKLLLVLNEVTYNKVNPFIKNSIELKIERIFKTFEGFKYKF